MKIREPIRLVIMYSDRPAIKRGRQSYISAQPAVFFSFFSRGSGKISSWPRYTELERTFSPINNCQVPVPRCRQV